MSNHEVITKLIKQAGSKLISVRFTKKDGSSRQLTFNPLDYAGIKGTGTPSTDPNIFRVRDISIAQWRSFDARRCHSIKVNGSLIKLSDESQCIS